MGGGVEPCWDGKWVLSCFYSKTCQLIVCQNENFPLSIFLSEPQLYTGNPSELCCGRDICEARWSQPDCETGLHRQQPPAHWRPHRYHADIKVGVFIKPVTVKDSRNILKSYETDKPKYINMTMFRMMKGAMFCVFAVVHRALVLRNGDSVVACAIIQPESPSAEQVFPNVVNLSRWFG